MPSAIVTIGIFAPLLGLVLDRLIFRPLTRANDSSKIMATVGVLVLFIDSPSTWCPTGTSHLERF